LAQPLKILLSISDLTISILSGVFNADNFPELVDCA